MTKNKTLIPLDQRIISGQFIFYLHANIDTMASCWVLVTIQPQVSVAMMYIIVMITGTLFMI